MDGHPLGASIPGSILWEDALEVDIEGEGTRFPVEVTDFEEQDWLPSSAAWYLDIPRGDLDITTLPIFEVVERRHFCIKALLQMRLNALRGPGCTDDEKVIISYVADEL